MEKDILLLVRAIVTGSSLISGEDEGKQLISHVDAIGVDDKMLPSSILGSRFGLDASNRSERKIKGRIRKIIILYDRAPISPLQIRSSSGLSRSVAGQRYSLIL